MVSLQYQCLLSLSLVFTHCISYKLLIEPTGDISLTDIFYLGNLAISEISRTE